MADWNPGQLPKIPRLYYVLRTLIIRAENYPEQQASHIQTCGILPSAWLFSEFPRSVRAFPPFNVFHVFNSNTFMQNNSTGTSKCAWSCLKIHLSAASCPWCLRHWIPPILSSNFNKGLFFFWVCIALPLLWIQSLIQKYERMEKMPLFRHIWNELFAM